MKLFKNKFFTSTIILILSGMSTKVLGLIIRIIFTRIVGTKTISLYTIVMPTYSLLLTICSLAMPTTISKLIAQSKNIKVLRSAFIIIFAINILMIFTMHLLAPFIANFLLHEKDSYYLLIAMSYTLPFASLACVLKGYYYGIQKMVPHVVSNTIEQIIRIILIITIMPHLIKISYVHAAVGLILTSFITELASIIVFILFLHKDEIITISKIKLDPKDAKNILHLSVPSVGSSIIANICYFLEPVLLTNILLYKGYSSKYILLNYGAYNAYAISTLTIPSFFINAICFAMIPEVSKYLENKNYYKVKLRFIQSIIFALTIGISFISIIYLFRYQIIDFLYNTNEGVNFIKILSPFFILFYFEAVFAAFMQAIGKVKVTFRITVLSSIVKLLFISILSFLKFGINALVIAEIINILMVVLLNTNYLNSYFRKLKKIA